MQVTDNVIFTVTFHCRNRLLYRILVQDIKQIKDKYRISHLKVIHVQMTQSETDHVLAS